MNDDYQTNLGWWTEKPVRTSQWFPDQRRSARASEAASHVWLNSILVVAVMFAFAWSLKSLAGW